MDINVIASGSLANCYQITIGHDDREVNLLLDCGFHHKKIVEDLNLSKIDGALITHAHMDHAKGVKWLLKMAVPCWMSEETAEILEVKGHHNVVIVHPKKPFMVKHVKCMGFPLIHDIDGHLGYLVQGLNNEKLLYITDTKNVGYVHKGILIPYGFKGITHLLLEINYTDKALEFNEEDGVVHPYLAKRIRQTHMGLEAALDFLEYFLKHNNPKVIHLVHVSAANASEKEISEALQDQNRFDNLNFEIHQPL